MNCLNRSVADELRIFESINHSYLVNHYGVEIHREEMLIFMEYCPEGTLESLLTSTENGLDEFIVRRYTRQLLEAVACLHEHGVVHRDIKGANIFLTEEMKTIKLGDFGCAVKIQAHTTMPGELQGFVGTQAYMAPEVFTRNMKGRRIFGPWLVWCWRWCRERGLGLTCSQTTRSCSRLEWGSHQKYQTISQKRGRTS